MHFFKAFTDFSYVNVKNNSNNMGVYLHVCFSKVSKKVYLADYSKASSLRYTNLAQFLIGSKNI